MNDYAVFNPHNKKVEDLPLIMGFVNGSFGRDVVGQLLAEDGTPLGSHISSSEGWLIGDLGIRTGAREDRHKTFKEHYPDGYRMDFVQGDDPRLDAAIEANKKLKPEPKGSEAKIEVTLS